MGPDLHVPPLSPHIYVQEFQGADAVLSSLEGVSFGELQQGGVAGRDDRASAAAV